MSPQVSFYILQEDTLEARVGFSCRLAEKAWRNGVPTHIYMTSEQDVVALDAMLWSYREDSFLPHTNLNSNKNAADEKDIQVPVTLGSKQEQLPDRSGLLINLGETIPTAIDSFERVAEVVVQEQSILELARSRFRQYKERGLTPQHQKVGKSS
ncbi:DNA polymerase III subunit chi [Parendozoicomonas sp. Alg238-R29]|uniref:DNA polymerase III subunit chi n=1 Tax=Parendozoicomonas sp. Alg238-R29 TaxID=2993446 RepID=UPI00248EF9BA|nr:DNA polymerase III subunit chi [Parendozoicomonas sp. Alg238-R29]